MKKSLNAAVPAMVTPEPPWGLQAGLQFIFVCVLATLLYSALSGTSSATSGQPTPVLFELDHLLRDVVRRANKFLDGDASLQLNGLSTSVGFWSLTALVANLLNALLLLIICLFGARRERVKMRILVAMFAFLAIVLAVITAPLLYATAFWPDGTQLPLDAAIASLLIYLCCLATDVAGALDFPAKSGERASYTSFILAVDIPCIGVTALFSVCALYISFPPEFVVGTVAALFAYYSLAFLLLSGFNWANTTGGRNMVARLKGNILLMIAAGAAFNGVIGTIVQVFKLPIYLDLAGSFIVGAMCGLIPGMLSAALGVLVLGFTTTPIALAYMGSAVLVTAAGVMLMRKGFMTSWLKTGLFGLIVLGPLSTLLSVPVTVFLFGGVTFAGSDAITLFFVKMGDGLFEAVIKGAILFDAVDKSLAALIAYAIYRRIPENMRAELRG